ncbi:MAG: PilN domain-containing protein [Desulfotignum sp.]|nr:PilN domain-containing protein [Desulfotignum sp.]
MICLPARKRWCLIPGRDLFFRNISLPFSSPGKIAQVLPLELAPYLPEDTCVSDFISLDIRFVKDQHLILTASAADAMVQEIISCLKDYHIRPRIITPREIAMAAACIRQSSLSAERIVIHAGLSGITLILMSGSKPVMVRSLALSDRTPDAIADHLLRLATGFRHRSGLDTRFHICLVQETDAMDPASLTKAIQQTDRQASFFFTDTVTVMEPDPALVPDLLLKNAGDLFNFARQYPGFGNFFHKFRREVLVTGIFGVLVAVLSVLTLYQDVHRLEKQVEAARRAGIEIYQQTFPQDTLMPGHSPLLRMQAQVKQAVAQNSGARFQDMAVTPALPAIDVLYELSARVPDGMNLRLSRLLLNNGQVTISGTTDSFNTVDRLKTSLEQSDIFKSVTIHTADAGRVENQVIFQFRIEI